MFSNLFVTKIFARMISCKSLNCSAETYSWLLQVVSRLKVNECFSEFLYTLYMSDANDQNVYRIEDGKRKTCRISVHLLWKNSVMMVRSKNFSYTSDDRP